MQKIGARKNCENEPFVNYRHHILERKKYLGIQKLLSSLQVFEIKHSFELRYEECQRSLLEAYVTTFKLSKLVHRCCWYAIYIRFLNLWNKNNIFFNTFVPFSNPGKKIIFLSTRVKDNHTLEECKILKSDYLVSVVNFK